MAPDLKPSNFEWKRRVRAKRWRNNTTKELLCCPEDVDACQSCSKNDGCVCDACNISICNECWWACCREEKIPKALCNDNFVGYVHAFIVKEEVRWIEAVIAGPVFSGLITYYIEGTDSERHHLMEEAVSKPARAVGIRGNLFSFLLPWTSIMQQLHTRIEKGDLSDWPLSPYVVAEIVRVRLVKGHEQLLNKFRQLEIRSRVVRGLAMLYIQRNQKDLENRPGVLKIHECMKQSDPITSLIAHVDDRLKTHYPNEVYNDAGATLPQIKAMVTEQAERQTKMVDSAIDMKQSTMPDNPKSTEALFDHVRPSIVTDEGTSEGTFRSEDVMAHGLQTASNLRVTMSNDFEDQFVTKYISRIFPWALNYDCGGPDFPYLFTQQEDSTDVASNADQRWRRQNNEAPLLSAEYAAMMATRPESQISGDWMIVPAARNLHWRYTVLRSAFLTCKQKVAPGETLEQNLQQLVAATATIWKRIQKNQVVIGGKKTNMNGNVAMIFAADDVTDTEKTILRSYLNTTESIAGCQQIRKQIGFQSSITLFCHLHYNASIICR